MPLYIGSTPIKISDDTKLPLAGGTLTGSLKINYGSPKLELISTGNSDTDIVTIKVGHKNYQRDLITCYKQQGGDYGENVVINSGGNLVIGSGESSTGLYTALKSNTNFNMDGEDLLLSSDGVTHIITNCQDVASRKGIRFTTSHEIIPEIKEVATNNVGSIGTSSYRWKNLYSYSGNFADTITSSKVTNTYLAGSKGSAIINSTSGNGSYTTVFKTNSTNGKFTMSCYQATLLVGYQTNASISAGTNGLTKQVTLLNESGNSTFPGLVTCSGGLKVRKQKNIYPIWNTIWCC